jgi:iron complex outermembrane receptor protein
MTAKVAVLLCSSSLVCGMSAHAQEGRLEPKPAEKVLAGAQDDAATSDDTIVVTGTLIRGIAPVGSATVGLSEQSIEASGATSTNDLLARIPQISGFGQKSTAGTNLTGNNATGMGVNQYFQTTPPNLRDLLANGAVGSTVTLIMLDGHRIVPVGTGGNAPDPDVVPPSALERVEVVLDGGSSLYGSDAIGGVINFITRKRYDGVGVRASYGFADDYYAYELGGIVGKEWNGGSAYVSYSYTKSDALFGSEREAIKAIDWNTGLPTGLQCDQANVNVGTHFYAMPNLTLGTKNLCDVTDNQAAIPAEERHSVLASFNQDIGDKINFEVKAFYTKRNMHGNGGTVFSNGTTVTVPNTYYYYRNLPGADSGKSQTVNFNYAPIVGDRYNVRDSQIVEWGITPQLHFDLGGNWQLRLMGNFGWSESQYKNQDVNLTLQRNYALGTTAATAINYYDLAATQNKSLIADVLNWQDSGFARSMLGNLRAVIDGPLLELPGGAVRLAAGAEYTHDSYKVRGGNTVRDAEDTLPFRHISRHVEALFGEVFVPVFGSGNATPGFHSLELSASIRWDHYSDFGDTTNPKFGITWAPFEGIQFRGSWAKSFNAPTLANQLASGNNYITATNSFLVIPTSGMPAPTSGQYNVVQQGSFPNLQPQTGKSWSVGMDLLPTLIDGFRATVNYYNVEFKGQLARPPIFDARLMFNEYRQYWNLAPTEAAFLDAIAGMSNEQAIKDQFLPWADKGALLIYEIMDYRLRNLGTTKLSGIDFSVGYRREVGFGTVDLTLDGNYKLHREFAGNGVVFTPFDLDLESRFKFAATLGTTVDDLRAELRWNHIGGYDVVRAANQPQDRVNASNTLDLYLRYDLSGVLKSKNLSVSLNVDNLFDQDPPENRLTGSPGFILASPIGRFVRFGINAGF